MSNKERVVYGVAFILIFVLPFIYIERDNILGILAGLFLLLLAYFAFFKKQ